MKFIDITEYGTNIKKSVATDKIKMLERIDYKSGDSATIVSFINETEIHVKESVETVKQLLSS